MQIFKTLASVGKKLQVFSADKKKGNSRIEKTININQCAAKYFN